MTIYDSRATPRWLRPTLRLRLTLVTGTLLLAGATFLVFLAWLLVRVSLDQAAGLDPTTTVTLEDGTTVNAGHWQDSLLDTATQTLLIDGALAVILVSVAGVAGAYLVTGRALRPLQQVTTTAQALSGDTLDQRIRYAGADDEVAELAATFDAMLDRISAAFDSQKRFVANASHELRTPLTIMRTEVDVTLSDPSAGLEDYQQMAKVVRDGSDRANALIEALLVLARSEAQAGRRLVRKVPADLADGAAAALSAARADAQRLSVVVTSDLQPAPVVGDPGLLERLAGNLVENAVRYNYLHGQLWVRTGGDDQHSWLSVRNTGVEVDPADVSILFEPFRRGNRDRTGGRGAGLGLSIVRAVVEAHGGTIASTANPDGGLEITVTLPAARLTPVVTATVPVPLR